MTRKITKSLLTAILCGLCLFVPQTSKANPYNQTPQEAIDLYISELQVGQPVEYENLRIFILGKPRYKHTKTEYLTLDEATDKKLLKIKEVNNYGTVNTVKMKNIGKTTAFVMKGEIIVGAKQDRMASRDILIPANGKWVKVPVFCVEHGRWKHKTKAFDSGKLCVPNSVRKRATQTESQSEVWAEISNLQYKCNVKSKSQTVVDNYQNKNIKKQLKQYTKHLKDIPNLSYKTVGVVVTTGDRIICVDSFASHKLFRKLWPKLLKSYAMDAINNGSKPTVEQEDVLELAEAILDQRPLENNKVIPKKHKDKLSEYFTCNCAAGTGSALIERIPTPKPKFKKETWEDIKSRRFFRVVFDTVDREIIHCDFFPKHKNSRPLGVITPPSERRSFDNHSTDRARYDSGFFLGHPRICL